MSCDVQYAFEWFTQYLKPTSFLYSMVYYFVHKRPWGPHHAHPSASNPESYFIKPSTYK
jgi:hypothetical protein